ncbi:MAG: DUF995 domain-containing protein [Phyllobacterium sp.]|uniref:DUF995 domain-containing protein n=1 Tax=Phyllobacterium sp. TaxID=1871046 RepID=UPI0030EFF47F
MKIFRALSLLSILAVVTTFAFEASAAQSKAAQPLAASVPLTSQELYKLYGNRSWIWKAGAGYFAVKQRAFTAWSADGGGSYGLGHWFITEPGKVCFKAVWYAKSGDAPALTCFSHRKRGNVTYQKREPGGNWYPFKSTPARKDDEYNKFRSGDYVASGLKRMRAKISRK